MCSDAHGRETLWLVPSPHNNISPRYIGGGGLRGPLAAADLAEEAAVRVHELRDDRHVHLLLFQDRLCGGIEGVVPCFVWDCSFGNRGCGAYLGPVRL